MSGAAPAPDAAAPSARGRPALGFLLLAAFGAALGLEVFGTPPWVRPTLSLSPLAGLLALAAALVPDRLRRSGRTARVFFAAGLLSLSAARLAERTALQLLGRPLDPAGDLPHVGAVAAMLTDDLPFGVAPAIAGGAALGILGLLLAGARGLRALGAAFSGTAAGPRVAAAALGVLAVGAPSLRPPGGAGAGALARIAAAPFAPPPPELEGAPLPPAPDLGGADVFAIFVESYGMAAFAEDTRRLRLEGSLHRLAADAAAGGFDFRSAQIQSPTFGGGSWRAHASLLTGVWIDTEARYRSLLASGRESLVRRFAAAGYRTLAFEPGIRGAWPEGQFYGFDEIRDQDGIGYRGPRIGWWVVPDQFTLHALAGEAAAASAPLFAKVSLIGSHIPYAPTPPYVEDWTRFDRGIAYRTGLKSIAHDDYRDLVELGDRYAGSLDHVFRIVGGFLRQPGIRRSLVVVLGDHQPPKLSLHESDSWATPIHLFSRDPALLEPWEDFGFARTLLPERETGWRMSDFPHSLSALFPGRPGSPAAGEPP